jgi:hypothetical protein
MLRLVRAIFPTHVFGKELRKEDPGLDEVGGLTRVWDLHLLPLDNSEQQSDMSHSPRRALYNV